MDQKRHIEIDQKTLAKEISEKYKVSENFAYTLIVDRFDKMWRDRLQISRMFSFKVKNFNNLLNRLEYYDFEDGKCNLKPVLKGLLKFSTDKDGNLKEVFDLNYVSNLIMSRREKIKKKRKKRALHKKNPRHNSATEL